MNQNLPLRLPRDGKPGGHELSHVLQGLAVGDASLFTLRRFAGDGTFSRRELVSYAFTPREAEEQVREAWRSGMDAAVVDVSPCTVDTPAVRLRLLTATEFLDDIAPAALVPGLLFERSSHLLTGASKAGKSWLATQLIMALASGERFLGLEVKQVPVLLCCLEMSAGVIRSRMETIAEDVGLPMPTVGEYFHVLAPTREGGSPSLNLGTDEGAEELAGLILRAGARVVVLDTLYRFLPGLDPNSNQEMGEVFGRLNALTQESNVALLLLDHVAKGANFGPTSHSAVGAGVKGGSVSAILALKRTSREDGGRWQVDVSSHYADQDEPLFYRRPARRDGTPGGGAVLCGAAEGFGLNLEHVRGLFRKYAPPDGDGRPTFVSKRKFVDALISAGHAAGKGDGAEIVRAIERAHAAPAHVRGWGADRPIETRDGPRNSTLFVWREPPQGRAGR